MRLNLYTFLFIALAFVSTADAKVQWGAKTMGESHAHTIRGFLYDISHNVNTPAHVILWRPNLAKALVWLNRTYAEKKAYQLEKLKKKEEAVIIASAIEAIANVVRGNHPQFKTNEEINFILERWTDLGKRVIVSYSKRKVKNPKIDKPKFNIIWTFKIKTKKIKYLLERW